MTEIRELQQAISSNNLDRVKELMAGNPELHRAPLGYMKHGPLTQVAECRVPWGILSPARLAIAGWMIANGSNVHQGCDAPLRLAALYAYRIPMMELLLAHGADVNAEPTDGDFPAVFAPCENMDPEPLAWLLQHGANPNSLHGDDRITPLDYLIGSHVRKPGFEACKNLLIAAGGKTTRIGS